MNKSLSDKIRNIEPYVPGEQPGGEGIIKLNTNENPYPPSPKAADVIKELNAERLRLYPSFKCHQLKKALCDIYKLNENQIFLGNGSDEVLAMCFMTFFNSNLPVLFADITYSFYDVWCGLFNISFKKVALDNDFKINIKDYLTPNGGIVIANPNAPTGVYSELSDIEEIIAFNKGCAVIIDEAYVDFGAKSTSMITLLLYIHFQNHEALPA